MSVTPLKTYREKTVPETEAHPNLIVQLETILSSQKVTSILALIPG